MNDEVIKQNLEMKLRISKEANEAKPGDLGTFVKNGELYIHPETFQKLTKYFPDLSTEVWGFYDSFDTYHSVFAEALGWPLEAGQQAKYTLADQLVGYFPDEILHHQRSDFTFGAGPDPESN